MPSPPHKNAFPHSALRHSTLRLLGTRHSALLYTFALSTQRATQPMRKRRRPVTKEEARLARRWRHEGSSHAEIATRLGCHRDTVRKICRHRRIHGKDREPRQGKDKRGDPRWHFAGPQGKSAESFRARHSDATPSCVGRCSRRVHEGSQGLDVSRFAVANASESSARAIGVALDASHVTASSAARYRVADAPVGALIRATNLRARCGC